MRIVLIMNPFGELPPNAIGAVEKLFYQLAEVWANEGGHEVTFVCAGGGTNPQIDYIRLLGYHSRGSLLRDLIPTFFFSLRALWKMPKCDVLICNTFWSPALAPLFRWKYRLLCYGVHRFPKRQFILYPFVHRFLCVSSWIATSVGNRFPRYRGRTVAILNPIDAVYFHPCDRRPVAGRVLFTGRIHPLKGLETLVKACAELYQEGSCQELVLVGTWELSRGGGGDEFVARLRQLAGDLPLSLPGPIFDGAKLAQTVASASVFAYPSEDVWGEACGVSPMEAMALGVPTVVSDLHCFDDYAIAGKTALRSRAGDIESLAQCLRILLSHPDEASRIGIAAGDCLCNYSANAVAIRYLEVFSAALK